MSLDLTYLGLTRPGKLYHNLPTARLYEEIIARGEGAIAQGGPMVVETGAYTGRSPNDKFIIREPSSEADIWWGSVNQPFEPEYFDAILARMQSHLQGRDLFVQDCYAGADPRYRVCTRIISQFSWHSLFARNMFIQEPDPQLLAAFEPDWHLIFAPEFQASPERDHTRSEVFILVHPDRKLILIGGTHYAGEMKNSIFSVLNYILPKQDIMSMHCSANMNAEGETALPFRPVPTGF